MLASGKLPSPANDGRCMECSLKDICQPEALGDRAKLAMYYSDLYRPDEREISE
jgi:CRISPR-associated exonuclease Cas4